MVTNMTLPVLPLRKETKFSTASQQV